MAKPTDWQSFASELVVSGSIVNTPWKAVKPAQYELNVQSDVRHFSIRQGLPTGSVYSVFEDADNMLWLGTNGEGACQYAGNYLRCFTSQHGLNNNRVWDIARSDNGHFWFATDQGISVLKGQSMYQVYRGDTLFDTKVNDILHVKDSAFIATDNGLYVISSGVLSKLESDITLKVNQLALNGESNIWLATDSGLYTLKDSILQHIHFSSSACQGPVAALVPTSERLWLGVTGRGVCNLDLNNYNEISISGIRMPNIQTLAYEQGNDVLWVGDDSKGVIGISGGAAYVLDKSNGLSDHHIRDITLGNDNIIWVATYGGGVNRIRQGGFELITQRNGLLNERVSALAEFDKQLWLGQYGAGIQVLKNGQWYTPHTTLANEYIHALERDRHGRVWVGTRAGLLILGNDESKHLHYKQGFDANIVHQFALGKDECMYLATQTGAMRACEGRFEKLLLAQETYVISIFEDSAGRLWFVTNGQGLYYIEDGMLFKISENEGLPSNWAYSITEASGNTVLVGTRQGVFAMKKGVNEWSTVHFNVKDGLSNNIVLSLFIDDKQLWIGTERGINSLALSALFSSSDPIEPVKYTHENGYIAIDSTLNTADKINDTIYWGSSYGVAYFNADNLMLPVNTTVSLLNVSVSQGNTPHPQFVSLYKQMATLPATTFQLRFQYSAQESGNPERVMYQTRLVGVSDYWSEPSNQSEITYTQLAAGEYEFQVRASAPYGADDYTSFSFIILPPWWQTWWAYTLALFVLITAIYSVLKWRFEFLQKQQRIRDRAEFSEALLQRKKQLLAEVSHEIRTPLSVLKMQIEGLEYNLIENTEKTYELLHRRISDINHMIADIDQLAMTELSELSLNIMPMDAVIWLNSWVLDAQNRVNQTADGQFDYILDLPSSLMVDADKERLTQVLNNVLSNSLRYSAPPIVIECKVTYSETHYMISLSDSAPGVSEEELALIFSRLYQSERNKSLFKGGTGLGLAISEDLVNRHGGVIEAFHSHLGGVAVNITLPR
ncbi:hypothetical protein PCIT_b0775 [Pseudoalteromonas citrea]|uniref:histidine kinase n=3 Tax=Pseudoalteromonas citrea TaxID=43655 RepID=A0AAD4AF57_9GAMM|nr:hypothetical protein PCIT_b0775 [Pseudoalteromonas citrea]